ncbi:MAG TPA: HAD-IA family hydrolase [Dehalococcoidia bacterium]|nr:HAD-IA family hydrolase [Dehalococcoidia bacterium]
MRYKAVLFDLFGTLVDNFTMSEYSKILENMAAVLNAPAEGFARLWRGYFTQRVNGTHLTHEDSIRIICQDLDVAVTEEQSQHAADIRLEYTVLSLKPKPEAVQVLTRLRKQGLKLGLISDCSPETPKAWPGTAFTPYFDVTIFSCEVNMKKPDPRIYKMATDRMGIKPEDCLYVGDGSSHELTGARAVGMQAVLIRHTDETVDEVVMEREDDWDGPRITRLREVLNLVK